MLGFNKILFLTSFINASYMTHAYTGLLQWWSITSFRTCKGRSVLSRPTRKIQTWTREEVTFLKNELYTVKYRYATKMYYIMGTIFSVINIEINCYWDSRYKIQLMTEQTQLNQPGLMCVCVRARMCACVCACVRARTRVCVCVWT